MSAHIRKWLCKDCGRRYVRPRRLRIVTRIVLGECWSCKGDLERVIAPIKANAFSGPSMVEWMLNRALQPGPKDWSPRGKKGIPRKRR